MTPIEQENAVRLQVRSDEMFLPVVTAFVEKGAQIFGLAPTQATELTLAIEEVFAYLCKADRNAQTVDIRCLGGGYYVRIDFFLSTRAFNMRAFNLTASVSLTDEGDLEEMGLRIASRLVDRLQFSETDGGGARLSLIKEKAYPVVLKTESIQTHPLNSFTVVAPLQEELKLVSQWITQAYPQQSIPSLFRFPGKVSDMVACGEYRAALAKGDGDRIGGCILWHWYGIKTVECFGPYIFNQRSPHPMAEELIDACIGDIAKTQAVCLINQYPTDELPLKHFERLGGWMGFLPEGTRITRTAYFRQMKEDPGTSVWCHPDLESFLQQEYRRLFLPREILTVRDFGESMPAFSVLWTEFDRPQAQVTIRPLQFGTDAKENIRSHVQVLAKEPATGVFFFMDLAHPRQTLFTPHLLEQGFTPRAVLPYAGDGDIAIFQLDASET